jgi:hypothetical protein
MKRETGKQHSAEDTQSLMTEGASSCDQQAIAEVFSNHFCSIVNTVNNKNAYKKTRTNEEIFAAHYYVLQNFFNPFFHLWFSNVSHQSKHKYN